MGLVHLRVYFIYGSGLSVGLVRLMGLLYLWALALALAPALSLAVCLFLSVCVSVFPFLHHTAGRISHSDLDRKSITGIPVSFSVSVSASLSLSLCVAWRGVRACVWQVVYAVAIWYARAEIREQELAAGGSACCSIS